MKRGILVFFVTFLLAANYADAASVRGTTATANRSGFATVQNQNVNPAASYTYNYMYPYLNNDMRTTLKPYDATSPSTSPINTVVRTEQLSAPRRVVPRPTSTSNVVTNSTAARAATNNVVARRVVQRPRSPLAADTTVARNVTRNQHVAENQLNNSKVISPARCLADYTECMNSYCERPNTSYNRCYCSAKLSQIDAEYRPQIETLIGQIYLLKENGTTDVSGIDEYWETTVEQYTGENPWAKIDDALDIDWASMESKVRGQNAFITAHDYCSQHIAGCFYMASNLRDAYRSAIAQDCAVYKDGLERLKNIAESVIEGYNQ